MTLKEQYDREGYVIVKQAIDRDLVREAESHVQWLIARNPGVRPEHKGDI